MKNTEGLGKLLKKQLNDIVNNNLSNLFTDNVFPPTDDSIYDDIHKTPFQKSKKNKLYQWVRLSEFEEFSNFNILKLPETYFKDEDVISEDVIQGHLGDCYLLSALSAFAEFPKRIQNILSESEINKSGIYKVKCYLHGIPEIVVLDDYFPCIKDELKKNNEGKYIDVKAIAFAGINKKTYNIFIIIQKRRQNLKTINLFSFCKEK